MLTSFFILNNIFLLLGNKKKFQKFIYRVYPDFVDLTAILFHLNRRFQVLTYDLWLNPFILLLVILIILLFKIKKSDARVSRC